MGKKVSKFFKMNQRKHFNITLCQKKVSTVFILWFNIVHVVRYFWFIFKVKIFLFEMLSLKFKDKNDILYNLV